MENNTSKLVVKPKSLYALFYPFKYIVVNLILLVAMAFLKPYIPFEYINYIIIICSSILLLAYLLQYLFIRSIKYTITDQQIIFTRGIFTITTDFIELYRVVDFKIVRSFLLRFIGGMSYQLDTLDKSHPTFTFKGIPKSNIDKLVRNVVEKQRKKSRVFITE